MPKLLSEDEPAAFRVLRPQSASPWLLLVDHASARLPRALGTLGLEPADLHRHIASDLGIAPLAERLSEALNACAALHNYSRLAIDCNRPLSAADSIAKRSEDTVIPGNLGLSSQAIEQRVNELFLPYHSAIKSLIDQRLAAGQATYLLSLHSYTPVYRGIARPWQVGVLYGREQRIGLQLLAGLRADTRLCVGDNEPYALSDDDDYSIPVHGEQRGLACVELEIRQDLLATDSGVADWCTRLLPLLRTCEDSLRASDA